MVIDIGRRQFISGLGGAAVASSLAVRAQQATAPVVAYLSQGVAADMAPLSAAFRRGPSEHGYVEGQNVTTVGVPRSGRH